jgi:mRNA-degrading endonuclease RelE of RelBE toxin-antitoxin system
MKRPLHQLSVPPDVARLIQNLHPDLKRKVRDALKQLLADPHTGKALKDDLEGLRSLRLGRIRIIYRLAGSKRLELVAIGPRAIIYEETYRRISKPPRRPTE